MTRAGNVRRAPERTCLGCGQAREKTDLLRFVASPAGELLADLKQKLPGRGAYLCREPVCLKKAVKKKAFGRALALSGVAQDEAGISAALQAQLLQRVESLVGMARKAGQLVAGSSQVLQAMDHPDSLALVICSEDISEGIGEKVRRKARATGVPCEALFTKAHLGTLVGRDERSTLAIARGGLAGEILQELRTYRKIVGEH